MTSAGQDAVARAAAPPSRREPLPLARSILWYPAGLGSRDTGMGRGGYPVFLDQSVINAVRTHIEASPNDPLLGFLAGELYVCSDIEVPYLVVGGVFVCRYPIENDDPMATFRRVWDRLRGEVERMHTQLNLYMWLIIARAVLSGVSPDPYNPIVRFVHSVTEPVLYQVRRRLPASFGGLDLSPVIVLMAIMFLERFVVESLHQMAAGVR